MGNDEKSAQAKKQEEECTSAPVNEIETGLVPEDVNYEKLAEVDEEEIENHSWADDKGVKYSLDKKRLLKAPRDLEGEYTLLPETEVICNKAFIRVDKLTQITFPKKLKCIGEDAFQSCESLTTIDLPTGIEFMGAGAFYEVKCETFTIPKSIKYLGEEALPISEKYLSKSKEYPIIKDCLIHNNVLLTYLGKKKSVVIPDGITVIGDNAFYQCDALQRIVIPDSVVEIGKYAFCGCSKIKKILIPDSVTSIGESAFRACESLQNMVIPDSVTELGKEVFYYCPSLKSVVLSKSLSRIKKSTFEYCGALQNIVIPDSVTQIDSCAFSECGLKSINIPQSVALIGNVAFQGSQSLKQINLPESTQVGRFAFCGTSIYDSLPDIVESVIDVFLKPFKGEFSDKGIDEIIEKIDEKDKDIYTKLVATIRSDGESQIIWSKIVVLNEENLRDFLSTIEDYCDRILDKPSDEVDFDVQYVSSIEEICDESDNNDFWSVDEILDGFSYVVSESIEGNGEEEEEDNDYRDEIQNSRDPYYLLNALFRINWSNGEKQYLFVDTDGDVHNFSRIHPYRSAAQYKQICEDIQAELGTDAQEVPTDFAIKNIIETTMTAYEGKLDASKIKRFSQKYNPEEEDTVAVATVDPNGIAKKIICSGDPLWQLLEDLLDEMDDYCTEELGKSCRYVKYKVEWPAKIQLLRGNIDDVYQEAYIVPYAINPNESDADDYRMDEDLGAYIKNSLVRIRWSNGEIQDLFIDDDFKVHDFNRMDKSNFPEGDRKSFDELIKD